MPNVDRSNVKLGKHPAVPDDRVPKLGTYVSGLPAPPASVNWYGKVKEWPMMLNNQLEDCTCAAVGHVIEQWTTYTQPSPTILTDQQVLTLYEKVLGYQPGNPSTDVGASVQQVLQCWYKNGAFGNPLNAYASVALQNQTELMQSVYLFGNAYLGIALPLSAKSQSVWDVPSGEPPQDERPGSWGGHAVPVVGYDAQTVTVVTWGALQTMTWDFYNTYVDECFALLSTEWTTSGVSPGGVSWNQLQADMQTLKAALNA